MSGTMKPWVLHVDLDQFIAAVEILRRPELAGLPVIVGGRGDPTERAVVSTASYEARERGVGSGMPLRIAARKIPDAVFLPVDKDHYLEASNAVMATLRAHPGAVVQIIGWDEAFVGVAAVDPAALAAEFGPRMGPWYSELGRGEGTATVDDTPWVARGHSRETTFQTDIASVEATSAFRDLFDQVWGDILAEGRDVIRVTLKVRYAPFTTKTYRPKIAPTRDRDEVWREVEQLSTKRVEPDRTIRLLGLHLEMVMPDDARTEHTPTRGGW